MTVYSAAITSAAEPVQLSTARFDLIDFSSILCIQREVAVDLFLDQNTEQLK